MNPIHTLCCKYTRSCWNSASEWSCLQLSPIMKKRKVQGNMPIVWCHPPLDEGLQGCGTSPSQDPQGHPWSARARCPSSIMSIAPCTGHTASAQFLHCARPLPSPGGLHMQSPLPSMHLFYSFSKLPFVCHSDPGQMSLWKVLFNWLCYTPS